MADFGTGHFHNLLLAGSRSSGKTTLAEALLFHAGALTRQGEVEKGTATSDYTPAEQRHHYSVYSSLLHADYKGKRINLVDMPGAADFIGQAIACLPAAEMMLLVLDPDAGVDAASRRLVRLARSRSLPVGVVVSHIGDGVDRLPGLLDELKQAFGRGCLPINLPAKGGTDVIGCLLNREGESDLGAVGDFHTELLDQVVEVDEGLMERYLEGEEPNYEALHAPFERALDEGLLTPICFVDALSGAGVDALLDVLVTHFPAPSEGNPRPFLKRRGDVEEPVVYRRDPEAPLLARVFHLASDPYLGRIGYVRVYQGRLQAGAKVFLGDERKPTRVGHLSQVQGGDREEVPELIAGDIGAVAKVEGLALGDVLYDDESLAGVRHQDLPYPVPLHALALVPESRGDEDKIHAVLQQIEAEDPTFDAHFDPETRELVIQGLGELHLGLVVERIREAGAEVTTKPPRVAYRETITRKAEGHYRHKKQSGGAGQFAEVMLRVEPLPRGAGFEFGDEVVGGAIPKGFMPAIEKGVRAVMRRGLLAGYPIEDVRVVVFDGKTHSVDSKEVAFKTAGGFAFKDAFEKAAPQLLEPVVEVEVTTPSDAVGAVTGDLSGRRGRVFGTDVIGAGSTLVRAHVPLAEMNDYAPTLKSMTQARGSYSLELAEYQPVPKRVADELIAAFAKERQKD